MQRRSHYNYFDQSPDNSRDFNLANQLDQEQFDLYGAAVLYYKVDPIKEHYDELMRDYISSPNYEEPLQVRAMAKLAGTTTTGMNHESGQSAEREGTIYFNISKIESDLGRPPIIGDVIEYRNEGKFMIYSLTKTVHRLGRYLRYACSVKLYQDTL